MSKKEIVVGEVVETLPGATFKVKLEDSRQIICYLSGKMRLFKIKVIVGDKVKVELSPYDKNRGRIVERIS